MLSSKRSRKLTHKATVSQEVGDVRMYTMFMSLDGSIADRHGKFDWANPDEDNEKKSGY